MAEQLDRADWKRLETLWIDLYNALATALAKSGGNAMDADLNAVRIKDEEVHAQLAAMLNRLGGPMPLAENPHDPNYSLLARIYATFWDAHEILHRAPHERNLMAFVGKLESGNWLIAEGLKLHA